MKKENNSQATPDKPKKKDKKKRSRELKKDDKSAGGANKLRRKQSYAAEIQDMMYTFGDAKESDRETVELVENIVRHYTIELLKKAILHSHKRGARMTVDDVIFQIRRDPPKLNRLKEFLSWKELRKKLKNTTDKTNDDISPEEMKDTSRPAKRRKVNLPWDFVNSLKGGIDDGADDDDSETRELDEQNRERLRLADEITQVMSREQYIEYSECRQASFTYKKIKKFRDWVDYPMNDETLEVLGYLAWEVVGMITQTGLQVKATMGGAPIVGRAEMTSTAGGLFTGKLAFTRAVPPSERGEALSPTHIAEAMRRLRGLNNSVVSKAPVQGL